METEQVQADRVREQAEEWAVAVAVAGWAAIALEQDPLEVVSVLPAERRSPTRSASLVIICNALLVAQRW